jgi:tetratricopeptide (TPR) repeat protein
MFESPATTSGQRFPMSAEDSAEPWIASGRVLLRRQRPAEALVQFEQALAVTPGHATAEFLRGEALFLLRDIERALASYHRAMNLGLARDPAAFHAAMSGAVAGDFGWFSAMLLGRFEEAWQISDRTLGQRLAAGQDDCHLPRHLRSVWRGESLAGKTVLVRCNHGLGDTIQFIRYIPSLRQRAARVLVEAPRELLPLLASVPGIDHLVALDEVPEASYDVEIELAELMHAFRTTLETIRAEVPYLSVAPERLMAQQRRLSHEPGFKAGAIRMGVAWAAGTWRPERSLPAALLAPLAAIPGVVLVNLQREPSGLRLVTRDAPPLVDAEQTSLDIAETAAIVRNLDLVISVDTMVAHLAGALGVPVWLLLHHASDWRWMLSGERSPWYPTMRLFRQPTPGDWDSVMADVADRLTQAAMGQQPVTPR